MHKPTVAVVVLVAALCACSDDDSSDDPTTTAASESTPAPSTTENIDITDPTEPPATAATTTTSTSTTTTSTTVPPPTVEEQIAADYQLIYDGYWACLRAPLNCDMSWLVPGSGGEEGMINTMQALVDRGRYVGEEDPGYYVIESITVGDDGRTAEVVSCWSLTGVLYGPPVDPSRPVGPDNPATLANNTPGSAIQTDQLALDDSQWRLDATTAYEPTSDVNQCPAEL
ncbi:MAG TPA: hypothetical protein VFV63_00435 [Ilumatobacteraceae bacterium]|nr:hypothetical protein [Ilumatobacteraceae bacterium]